MCLPDHLKALVKTVQTDPNYVTDENTTMPVHNGETGELLRPLPAPFGWRVKRKMWLDMLHKDLDIRVRPAYPNLLPHHYAQLTAYSGAKKSRTFRRATIP
jgi:hypothetical protein